MAYMYSRTLGTIRLCQRPCQLVHLPYQAWPVIPPCIIAVANKCHILGAKNKME